MVLYLVSSQLNSQVSQYLAGIRHILGIKVAFASPQEISFDDFLSSIASQRFPRVDHQVSSKPVSSRVNSFKAYSQSPGHSCELIMLLCENTFVSQSYPFHDSLGFFSSI